MLSKYHLKSLDGIRGVACILVILAHYMIQRGVGNNYGEQFGALGVIIFFVLSGFLMMHVTKNLQFNFMDVKLFFIKRFSRIIPFFYISVIIIFLYQNISKIFSINNKFLAFNEISNIKELFMNLIFIKGDGVFWSIGPELVFYTIFVGLWYFRKYGNIIFLCVCVSIFLFARSTGFYNDWNINFTRIGFTIQYFLFGSFSYIFFQDKMRNENKNDLIFLVSFILILSFSPYLGSNITGYNIIPVEFKSLYTKQIYLYFIVPFFVVSAANSKLANIFLGNVLLTFLGKISFSMYVWHYIFIRMFVNFIGNPNINGTLFFVFFLMPIISLSSYISYRFIETPSSKWVYHFLCKKFLL